MYDVKRDTNLFVNTPMVELRYAYNVGVSAFKFRHTNLCTQGTCISTTCTRISLPHLCASATIQGLCC